MIVGLNNDLKRGYPVKDWIAFLYALNLKRILGLKTSGSSIIP